MISLDTLHPAVKREFEDGKFVVNKTGRGFSSIALDHAHEQNNKLVKGDGGAIGLTENSTQLLRWMVCGPEVARVIQEFHTLLDGSKGEAVKSHHEELPSVQRNFKSQVHGLCDAICESGNPFTDESSDLLVLGSRDILPSNVVDTVDKIYLEGEKQYNAFVEERFRKREKSLYDPIHQNKFALFNSPAPREVAKEKQNITSLKQNCSLFSQLYIACQVRDGDLDDFFRHENQDTPPSLSQYGSLRTGSKSDLIQCLESGLRVQEEPSNIDMLLIDGAALVNMLLPRGAKTFLEYAETVFIPYIISQLSRVQRIDIIWDVYESNSLKHSTRVRRGKGLRRRVMSDTTLPGNWSLFLRDNENKEELFVFLADELTKIQCDKDVISTYGSNILHNLYDETAVEHLSPCSHEEADTRILLHMADASRKGFSKVAIRTVDTDVLVLAIAAFHQLSITEIWLIFGTGLNLRFIPVHDIAQELGEEKSSCIHVFHALTGCDQTSFFSGRGKKSAWQTWSTYPALTSALQMISKTPSDADLLTSLPTFERFTVLLYDKTSNCLTTDEARKDLFTRKGRSMEGIPPTSAALLQHLKRVVYQAGFVWGQALTKNPTLPLPSDWGWRLNQCNRWEPLWTILDSASESCKELIRCGCNPSIGCKGRCKCLKAEMACTALCKCGGQCDRG
ncbi:hypothetical protein FSP39_005574 [Pinctada imbricata]|uniref:Tesmin/TSO1-like CXC domain-containing protein n=1 Tax=Pinctada imbricata TaxID=66713 RepID=A0AA88Y3B3_PINIB|nr:hypothetical protein FSP39_005574 [Pinctada imbricata]